MPTLLILGSKPEPALPPRSSYDALACANASGYSAAAHGLPDPVYTVMTSLLASGIGSGRQSLDALKGLRTDKIYFLKRRARQTNPLRSLIFYAKNLQKKNYLKMQPFYLRRVLRSLPYGFDDFVPLSEDEYDGLVKRYCADDPSLLSLIERKRPSTGLIALALGLEDGRWDRFIVSGFSFELTHAYGRNPEIDERGTAASSHADTDVMVMRHLGKKLGTIYTTEATVHAQAGLPMLPEGSVAGSLR